jgi:hypothetical protein
VQETPFAIPANFRPVFSVGEVLGNGFRALFQRPLFFLGLAFAGLLPLGLLGLIAGVNIDVETFQNVGPSAIPAWFWLAAVVVVILGSVPSVAIIHGAVEHMQGREPSFGASLAVGFQRLLPSLVVNLLFAIIVGFGSILLVVPGIILACMFFVASPVTIVERRGIFASLGRARALSKGYRVTMFVLGVVTTLLAIAMAIVLNVYDQLTGAVGSAAGPVIETVLSWPVSFFAQLVQTAIFPILAAATYAGLRAEKEGGSADQVAGVFT